MMNSLTFCLFGKGFISLSFLKDNFAWYRILGWQVFFFLFCHYKLYINQQHNLKDGGVCSGE